MPTKKIIALDIGGTKIEAVLFDEKFKQLKKERIFWPKKEGEFGVNLPQKKVLQTIEEIILKLKDKERNISVGVCFPAVIDKKGAVKGESKIKALSNFPLKEHLEKKIKLPVIIGNDADCFALGEWKKGAGKGKKNMLGVIWGTGIGGGLILNNQLYASSFGSVAEIGHMVINLAGPKGWHDTWGTLEAICSGAGLVRNYVVKGGKIKNPDPKKIYNSKEKIAKEVTKEMLEHFAMGLASLMNVLGPELIVLGGGLSQLPVYRKLNKLAKKYTRSGLKEHIKIVPNKLGDSAGTYGAAVLALEEY